MSETQETHKLALIQFHRSDYSDNAWISHAKR